jgi:hypothetical protein
MKNKQLISEVKRFQEIAGIRREVSTPDYGGSDSVPEFEFTLDGKEYIANLSVNYKFNWDSEDGIYDYQQEIEIEELGVAEPGADEYTPVTDQAEISKVQSDINVDPKISKSIEGMLDLSNADRDSDYADELDEEDDYDMGTPSGDTDAMNIG